MGMPVNGYSDPEQNFVITYNDGSRTTELLLNDYYEGSHAPETPNTEDQAGLWVLLKKATLTEGDLADN